MTTRLRRFEENRFIGTRDDMVVYDCDDPAAFTAIQTRVDLEELVARLLISTFSPDTLAEARNRGFSPS